MAIFVFCLFCLFVTLTAVAALLGAHVIREQSRLLTELLGRVASLEAAGADVRVERLESVVADVILQRRPLLFAQHADRVLQIRDGLVDRGAYPHAAMDEAKKFVEKEDRDRQRAFEAVVGAIELSRGKL